MIEEVQTQPNINPQNTGELFEKSKKIFKTEIKLILGMLVLFLGGGLFLAGSGFSFLAYAPILVLVSIVIAVLFIIQIVRGIKVNKELKKLGNKNKALSNLHRVIFIFVIFWVVVNVGLYLYAILNP